MTLLSLTKNRDDALKALASAGDAGARKKALARLEAASRALANFEVKLAAKAAARKPAASVDADEDGDDEDEDEESEEEEEEESTDSSDDEPKKPMEKKKTKAKSKDKDDDKDDDDSDDEDGDDDEEDEEEETSDSGDDDDDEEEEEDDEEEEERAASATALASARSVLSAAKKSNDVRSVSSARAHFKSIKSAIAVMGKSSARYRKLKAVCAAATGKTGLESILGGIQGLAVKAAQEEANTRDIAKMKATAKAKRVTDMLATAIADGKITSKTGKLLRDGMTNTKTLKAYLEALPKLVRTQKDGELVGRTLRGSTDETADKDRAEALSFQNLSAEQQKFVTEEAASQGKSIDDFMKSMVKVTEKIAGTSPLSVKREAVDFREYRDLRSNGPVTVGN
jgi:hypothetical protein